jgi:hypothetical protein
MTGLEMVQNMWWQLHIPLKAPARMAHGWEAQLR